MELSPREKDKLLIFTAALLAERRKARGLKLNYPEAVAFITAAILEGARDGRTVAELMSHGTTLLGPDDVMDGVADLIPEVQVEATFPDGTKLVTVHHPIGGSSANPPGLVEPVAAGPITLNRDREAITLSVANGGDRPIQVGSHYHFFETNPALQFDRALCRGYRLNIPAGTAVRFEPGQSRQVELVPLSGERVVHGFRGEVMGPLDGPPPRETTGKRQTTGKPKTTDKATRRPKKATAKAPAKSRAPAKSKAPSKTRSAKAKTTGGKKTAKARKGGRR